MLSTQAFPKKVADSATWHHREDGPTNVKRQQETLDRQLLKGGQGEWQLTSDKKKINDSVSQFWGFFIYKYMWQGKFKSSLIPRNYHG